MPAPHPPEFRQRAVAWFPRMTPSSSCPSSRRSNPLTGSGLLGGGAPSGEVSAARGQARSTRAGVMIRSSVNRCSVAGTTWSVLAAVLLSTRRWGSGGASVWCGSAGGGRAGVVTDASSGAAGGRGMSRSPSMSRSSRASSGSVAWATTSSAARCWVSVVRLRVVPVSGTGGLGRRRSSPLEVSWASSRRIATSTLPLVAPVVGRRPLRPRGRLRGLGGVVCGARWGDGLDSKH